MSKVQTPVTPRLSLPVSKDKGIPLKFQASGAGGQVFSTQTTTATSSSQIVFSKVIDGGALLKRLGLDSSDASQANRDALALELRKPGGADVANVKQYLQVLVAENKARCNGQTPDRLHIYMGFGDVMGVDRKAALKLATSLREKANNLLGHINDPDCKQMLNWIADAWGSYSRIFAKEQANESSMRSYRQPTPRSGANLDDARSQSQSMVHGRGPAGAGDSTLTSAFVDHSNEEQSAASESQELKQPKTTQGNTGSNFSGGKSAAVGATTTSATVTTATATGTTTTTALMGAVTNVNLYADLDIAHASSDVILARAKLRDDLMSALAEGDEKKLAALLRLLPPSLEEPAYYFPEPDPDPEIAYGASYETLLSLANAYTDANPKGETFRKFVAYGADVEQMALWSKTFRATWTGQAASAQKVCSLLRGVKETQLGALAKSIAPVIAAAVKDYKTLADDLAAQPIAKLSMLRDKCTVLAPYMDETVMAQFLEAIKDARSLQRKAIKTLRDELIKYPINEAEVMRHLMVECARACTTDLIDDVSRHAKPQELLTMMQRLTELGGRIASGANAFTAEQGRAVKFMIWKLDLVLKGKDLWGTDLNKHMQSKG